MRGKFEDVTGFRFGKLIAVERVPKPLHLKCKAVYYRCICDCGNEKIIKSYSLRSGATKSCGCLIKTQVSNPNNTNTHRQCFDCLETKSLDEFIKSKNSLLGYGYLCRPCSRSRNRNRYKSPDFREHNYFLAINRIYNLSKEEFYNILGNQNFLCVICKKELICDFSSKDHDIAVDHCHESNIVRGILHNKCNTIYVSDHTVETARNLLNYLLSFQS